MFFLSLISSIKYADMGPSLAIVGNASTAETSEAADELPPLPDSPMADKETSPKADEENNPIADGETSHIANEETSPVTEEESNLTFEEIIAKQIEVFGDTMFADEDLDFYEEWDLGEAVVPAQYTERSVPKWHRLVQHPPNASQKVLARICGVGDVVTFDTVRGMLAAEKEKAAKVEKRRRREANVGKESYDSEKLEGSRKEYVGEASPEGHLPGQTKEVPRKESLPAEDLAIARSKYESITDFQMEKKQPNSKGKGKQMEPVAGAQKPVGAMGDGSSAGDLWNGPFMAAPGGQKHATDASREEKRRGRKSRKAVGKQKNRQGREGYEEALAAAAAVAAAAVVVFTAPTASDFEGELAEIISRGMLAARLDVAEDKIRSLGSLKGMALGETTGSQVGQNVVKTAKEMERVLLLKLHRANVIAAELELEGSPTREDRG